MGTASVSLCPQTLAAGGPTLIRPQFRAVDSGSVRSRTPGNSSPEGARSPQLGRQAPDLQGGRERCQAPQDGMGRTRCPAGLFARSAGAIEAQWPFRLGVASEGPSHHIAARKPCVAGLQRHRPRTPGRESYAVNHPLAGSVWAHAGRRTVRHPGSAHALQPGPSHVVVRRLSWQLDAMTMQLHQFPKPRINKKN